jgi:spore coat polysaccharide biosynthesis protein SpsF (cytidylyltransferase family)
MTTAEQSTKPVVAIIQARMTSTRLPGKVLTNIAGRTSLECMIARVRGSQRLSNIVVATTVNAADDPVVALCEKLGVATFRGDEVDVLGRFQAAAQSVDAAHIMRLTADCPMLDPGVLDDMIEMYTSGNWDYVSNCINRTYPDGLDAEVFTREALDEAAAVATHPILREHVTPYIRGVLPELGAGDFRRGDLLFTADFSHLRWTLDTTEDLTLIRRLVSALPEGYSWLDAVALATREPELLQSVSEPPSE